MKQLLLAAVAASTFLMAGCASSSPDKAALQQEIDRTIPTCSTATECAAKWDAAQLWIAKNAGWKIQTVTNVLIETHNPVGTSTSIAVRVLKEPLGGGKFRIMGEIWCGNMFGCTPNTSEALIDFNKTVGAAQ